MLPQKYIITLNIEVGDRDSLLQLFGTSHKLLGVEERETLAFSDDEIPEVLAELTADPRINEACIVTTCNRVEFYVSCDAALCLPRHIRALYERRRGIDIREYHDGFFFMKDADAVRHLFRVISSLESMVLGEVEVVHQLKRMYRLASEAGATGIVLHRAFHDAFRVGKKVRSATAISAGSTSVAMIAVDHVLQHRGRLDRAHATVIGAGPMARRMARYLLKRGVASLTLMNRTESRVRGFADEIGVDCLPLDELDAAIARSDILMVGIRHERYLLDAETIRAIGARRDRPLTIVDIGVPRVVAHVSSDAAGVEVFDIDDLSEVLTDNIARRREAAAEAATIIERYVDGYTRRKVKQTCEDDAGRDADRLSGESLDLIRGFASSLSERCTCTTSPCLE